MLNRISFQRHIWETLWLAMPIILGQMSHIIVSTADTKMIGGILPLDGSDAYSLEFLTSTALAKGMFWLPMGLGPGAAFGIAPLISGEPFTADYLAAAALSNSLFWIPMAFGVGISYGITPLVSQYLGAKNKEAAGSMLSSSIWVALIVGFILFLIIMGLVAILPLLDQKLIVTILAQEYLLILGISIIPMVFMMTLKQYLEGYKVVLPGMLILFGVVGINIFFNYALINGNLGFPRLALNGDGWATLISRTAGAIIFILCILFAMPRFRAFMRPKYMLRINKAQIKRIFKIGLPVGFQFFFEVGCFSGAVIILGWLKEGEFNDPAIQQSAHNIAITLAAIAYMVYSGIAGAASIRVGNFLGAQNYLETRRAGFAAMVSGGLFILIGVVLFIVGRYSFPTFIIEQPEVVELASRLLIIGAIFQIGDGLQAISMGALRGISDVRIPTITAFFAYIVLGLGTGYVFCIPLGMEAEGMWYGFTVGLVGSSVFLTLRFHLMSKWKRLEQYWQENLKQDAQQQESPAEDIVTNPG